MKRTPIVIVLPDIRSAMNVGAILRTADGINAEHIYLTGYTATPEHPKVVKTSLGAELSMPWSYESDTLDLLKRLKNEGYQITGLELDSKSKKIWDVSFDFPLALIVGNEIHGIPISQINLCDKVVYLPMLGTKESLNVATSTGVALYELLRMYEFAKK